MSMHSLISDNSQPYSTLFFIYNVSLQNLFFSSEPAEHFFETTIDWDQQFPFEKFVDQHHKLELEKNWQDCLSLPEKHSSGFRFLKKSIDSGFRLFQFDALGIHAPASDNSRLVLFAVKKSTQPAHQSVSADTYQKDYAEFIEVAAHDLDAPLRKISLLLDRVVNKSQTAGDHDLRTYFDRIQSGLHEMRTMIDQLTSWVSGNEPLNITVYNLEDLVIESLHDLRNKYEGIPIDINVEKLLSLECDARQLKQALHQLMDNAIRFRKKDEPLRIVVNGSLASEDDKLKYALDKDRTYIKLQIADNGIGVQPEFSDKIFRPFFRLHGKSEYPGSGMGLAICKKIVENHGGIIYADSNQNKGATFSLILPQCHSQNC